MANQTFWEAEVIDPKERRVFEALADPKWDFRTVAGLMEDTGISEKEVRAILDKHAKFVRKSLVPDRMGRELYTLRSRGVTTQEVLAGTRTVIAKS